MKITVTKKDIQNGIALENRLCPIALAISRKTKYAPNVSTSIVDIYRRGIWCLDVDLPKSAKNFIKKFDAGKKVKPFTFNLKIK